MSSSAAISKPKGTHKNKFTSEDDLLLTKAVNRSGAQDWNQIATHVPGRTARQCRERWKNYLDPNIQTSNWSAEEDQLLQKLTSEIGPKWSQIAPFFPNRTDVYLKNKYIGIVRREKRSTNKTHAQFPHITHTRQIIKPEIPTYEPQCPVSNAMVTQDDLIFADVEFCAISSMSENDLYGYDDWFDIQLF